MATRGKELLTADQRAEFVQIPTDMTERELETYYTFSQFDLEIIKRHRRDHNRLGFAVQLCVLRYPGWSLSDVEPSKLKENTKSGTRSSLNLVFKKFPSFYF
jgi:TnpA family transposase